MTEQEARGAAQAQRGDHAVPAGWEAIAAERRWIELPEGKPEVAAPVRDLLAWVVRFGDDLAWVELALDDRDRRVVRVERSR